MTEEEDERAREKYNTMEKGLQLTPIEKALVIITDDQTELVQKFSFYTTEVDELEMLAASLTTILYDTFKKRNMSQEECLSFSEIFFKQVKDKYKERFFKEGEIYD
jgi:hypothetical protein